MTKPKGTKKTGRPGLDKRGRSMAFYVKPEEEDLIRLRAKAEGKTITAVIMDAVKKNIGKEKA